MATSPLSATFQARQTRLDSLCPGGVRDEQSSSAGAILFCKCGCGGKTKIAKNTNKRYGRIAGLPNDYIHGHARIGKPIEDCVIPEPNSGCHLWIGSLTVDGYGQKMHLGKSRMAHRLVYEMEHGEIPSGMTVDHLCRIRSCVNPKHMEIVTGRENTLRGNGPTALNAKKKFCPRCFGSYTPDRRGERRCNNCQRDKKKNKYALKKRTSTWRTT